MIRAYSVIWLLVISAAIFLAWFHPQPPAWTEDESQRRLLDDNATGGISIRELPREALLIDVRSEKVYRDSPVSGAVYLNLNEWETSFAELLMEWSPNRISVVFCDETCQISKEVAARLRRELATEEVYYLVGGRAVLQGWQ